MTGGVRAELAVQGPSNCPVATVSERAPVTEVTWGQAGETAVEEFRVDGADDDAAAVADAEPMLDVGDERVYQFERDPDGACACEVVEGLGTPVADVRAESGTLVLTLHLPSVERLRAVVAELDAVAEEVTVRYLVHAAADGETGADRTVVDRGQLTDRQREVLRTAYEMGYFEYPRGANATEVAEALDIGLSALAEHLAAAQGKLLAALLAE
ncbi:helix-turn-helix domain-containing protein [Haloglomus litoreum]|uniref:helix-turn-helix domain-containing protein n=1 Tax=Haloglomus litoreum TaxID=3034026 RepID=UPI0023E86187|nr:helix-turn-helix domain-containing protein [Haloglomus sp. DT116]